MKTFEIAYKMRNCAHWSGFSVNAKNERRALRALRRSIGIKPAVTWTFYAGDEFPFQSFPQFLLYLNEYFTEKYL